MEQYSNNVTMLSQQMGSLLRNAVDVETVKGKNAFFEQIGEVTAQVRTSRHSDTPQLDTPHSRRRVSLADYEWADLIDDQDKIRMLIDPTSSYAKAAAAAMGRSMDDVIITALGGTAQYRSIWWYFYSFTIFTEAFFCFTIRWFNNRQTIRS